MLEKLKVSVIVPVYKSETFLNYCVDSILAQTYRNLEVILVDDGSPDSSGFICDTYAQRDHRICVIHKENGGVSEARNAGIKAATGDYISFVDHDDVLPVYAMSVMVEAALDNKADVVQGNTMKIRSYKDTCTYTRGYKTEVFVPEEFIESSAGGYRTDVWNKLYKRSIARKYEFPTGHYPEDIYYNALIFSDDSVKTIVHVDVYTYLFLDNPTSTSHSWRSVHYVDMQNTLFELSGIIKERTSNERIYNTYLMVYLSQFCSQKYNIIIRNQYEQGIRELFNKNRKIKIGELWKSNVKTIKKIAYTLLTRSNFLYRQYVFHTDPTMRVYERNVKNICE